MLFRQRTALNAAVVEMGGSKGKSSRRMVAAGSRDDTRESLRALSLCAHDVNVAKNRRMRIHVMYHTVCLRSPKAYGIESSCPPADSI